MKKEIQNYPVYIYYLYNYETDEVFYVGATKKKELSDILHNHIYITNKRWGKTDTIFHKRCDYIRKHRANLSIHLLETTDYINANGRECHYYHYFIKQGFTLIQSDDSFHYNRPIAMTTDQVLDYERTPKKVYRVEDVEVKKVA